MIDHHVPRWTVRLTHMLLHYVVLPWLWYYDAFIGYAYLHACNASLVKVPPYSTQLTPLMLWSLGMRPVVEQ